MSGKIWEGLERSEEDGVRDGQIDKWSDGRGEKRELGEDTVD